MGTLLPFLQKLLSCSPLEVLGTWKRRNFKFDNFHLVYFFCNYVILGGTLSKYFQNNILETDISSASE